MLQIIFALISMIVGGLSSLTMLVFLMAGGANASPAHIRQIKWMMVSVAVVQALALTGSIWALTQHRGGIACAAGIAPFLYVIVLMIVLVTIEW